MHMNDMRPCVENAIIPVGCSARVHRQRDDAAVTKRCARNDDGAGVGRALHTKTEKCA